MKYYILGHYPLASSVLAVAVRGETEKDWAAYVYAVPGINHEREALLVAENGEKLPQEVATFLFPTIAKQYIWRK